MFAGMVALQIAFNALSELERVAKERGEPVNTEFVRELIAGARRVHEDEVMAYEDAGLLPVYPRQTDGRA